MLRPLWQSHCAHGVVSRNGWAVINDTGNPTLDNTDWWTGQSNVDLADLYLFAHGHNYKQAILDFTKVGRVIWLFSFLQIAGTIAMVPRYMSGVYWTRS
jgi:hypothetical protein